MMNKLTTKLTKEAKIILLNILRAQQITPEQKNKLTELLKIETTTYIFENSICSQNNNR